MTRAEVLERDLARWEQQACAITGKLHCTCNECVADGADREAAITAARQSTVVPRVSP